ncbi:hypothetical protein ACFOSS_06375 [Pseudaeromonas sharmana]|uniref:Uncharacterized protein n=1 Tax=Pseudaeromonas sharmana TaxID=328412 RepID=A0ABV8CM97_9GAMM
MSRWTLLLALVLVGGLLWQPATAVLSVQQPAVTDTHHSAVSRALSQHHDMGAMAAADCHDVQPTASTPDHCNGLSMWLGMELAGQHCHACVPMVAEAPDTTPLLVLAPREPERVMPLPALGYADFIPGIPSPPPCLPLV